MLCKSILAALLATSLLLTDAIVADDAAQPAAVAPAAALTAPVVAVEPALLAPAGVTGKVMFRGEKPKAAAIDMAADPVCAGLYADGRMHEKVVVSDNGGLAHVFVSLTGVPDERYKAPDTSVLLDQRGCMYEPHVFGVMAKQEIEILNSDDTLHNIHAVPRKNKEFNVGMPEKGMKITKEFKKDEDAIQIKCDVHPWMVAWCFSMEHPYFAVSGTDGSLTLPVEGLPDGEYGVRLWHETLGEATTKVTVAGGSGSFEHAYK